MKPLVCSCLAASALLLVSGTLAAQPADERLPMAQDAANPEDDASLHPEPMYFDLVLGLGAHAGDVEMNTLASTEWREHMQSSWGPELEVAPLDGWALEVELPHVSEHLEALKAATQVTLPSGYAHVRHGVQTIYERGLPASEQSATLLYVLSLAGSPIEPSRWSLLGLFGGRAYVAASPFRDWRTLCNASAFYALWAATAAGIEANVEMKAAAVEQLRILPQLHQNFGNHFALQLGVGLVWHRAARSAMGALRVVVK